MTVNTQEHYCRHRCPSHSPPTYCASSPRPCFSLFAARFLWASRNSHPGGLWGCLWAATDCVNSGLTFRWDKPLLCCYSPLPSPSPSTSLPHLPPSPSQLIVYLHCLINFRVLLSNLMLGCPWEFHYVCSLILKGLLFLPSHLLASFHFFIFYISQ